MFNPHMENENAGWSAVRNALLWLKGAGVDYASFMRRILVLAAWIVGACLIVALVGLFTRMAPWIPGAAIAVAGLTVTGILVLSSPILLPLEWLVGLDLASPIRRMIHSRLVFLFWSLFAATFIALIPRDSDPSVKFLFVIVSLLIAFGISIKTIDISPDQIVRVATWKLITLFLFLGFAVSFPRTGKAILDLRPRLDRSVRNVLVGPILPNETAFSRLRCDQLPREIWSRSGDTLLWFSRTPDGGYELFTGGGHHPTRGTELVPVSSDSEVQSITAFCEGIRASAASAARAAADSIRTRDDSVRQAELRAAEAQAAIQQQRDLEVRQARERAVLNAARDRRDSYLLARQLPRKVEFAVIASTDAQQPMEFLASAVASELGRHGTLASSIVFSSKFVTTGAFEATFNGRGASDIREMPLKEIASHVMLVRVRTGAAAPSASVSGAFSTVASATVSVVSTNDGSVRDVFDLSVVGVGASARGATQSAHDRLVKEIGQRKY